MRFNLLHGIAATLAIAAASPALAQDGEDAPFSGLYVAASGGYDVQGNDVNSRFNFDRNGDFNFNEAVTTAAGANAFSPGFCNGRATATSPNERCENDRNKPSYYGRVGFDVQRGSFVVGVLGEIGRTEINDYTSAFSTTPASYTFERGVTWESSGRIRAGIAQGNGLFYATGGVGYARLKHRFTTSNTANSFSALIDDRDRFGFLVGGGTEYRINKNVSIGLEYSFHQYKDNQYYVRVAPGTAPATNPFILAPFISGTTLERSDDKFRWHSLRGVIGFHF